LYDEKIELYERMLNYKDQIIEKPEGLLNINDYKKLIVAAYMEATLR